MVVVVVVVVVVLASSGPRLQIVCVHVLLVVLVVKLMELRAKQQCFLQLSLVQFRPEAAIDERSRAVATK